VRYACLQTHRPTRRVLGASPAGLNVLPSSLLVTRDRLVRAGRRRVCARPTAGRLGPKARLVRNGKTGCLRETNGGDVTRHPPRFAIRPRGVLVADEATASSEGGEGSCPKSPSNTGFDPIALN